MNTRALIVTLLAVLAFPAAASAAPTVQISAGPNPAHRGEAVTAKLRVTGAAGTVQTQWTVDGKVAPKFSDLDFSNLEHAYGIGFRVIAARTVIFRLDLATGSEGMRTVVKYSRVF